MIVLKLILGLLLLNSSPTQDALPAPDPHVVVMQSKADVFEATVLESLPGLHERHPRISKELFIALIEDIDKLSKEKVTDPTFRADWDQFGDDIDSMQWAVDNDAKWDMA